MGKRILVVTGGEGAGLSAISSSGAPYDLVIAADGGLDVAQGLGIRPDIVIGDLDSASFAALERARADGSEIEAHPAEKDHTDFELALKRAMAEGAAEIAVIGGGGGRPDHWLANLSLLGAVARAGASISAEMGDSSVAVVVPDQPYSEAHPKGELLSLLPVSGDVRGITTEGLSYPLHAEDLAAASSRGVSNVTCGGLVRLEIQEGTLLVIRPRDVSLNSTRDKEAR